MKKDVKEAKRVLKAYEGEAILLQRRLDSLNKEKDRKERTSIERLLKKMLVRIDLAKAYIKKLEKEGE